MHVITYLLGGEEPGPAGTRSPFFAPYEAYRTADGHLVVVGTGGRDSWGALCRVVGLEPLVEDPRFATNADRVRNADALRDELEAVLSTRPSIDWVAELEAVGVACAPVQRLSEVLASEQVRALGMIGSLDHPVAGDIPTVRLPLTMSESDTTATVPPPTLGGG
jgi:crotonobetainyl-CoA:carnitine CoA-transferase CaiB-like acyl-CoA transferase